MKSEFPVERANRRRPALTVWALAFASLPRD
jgi:hypothetical protein